MRIKVKDVRGNVHFINPDHIIDVVDESYEGNITRDRLSPTGQVVPHQERGMISVIAIYLCGFMLTNNPVECRGDEATKVLDFMEVQANESQIERRVAS